jgi:hypothetical protein
MRNLGREYWKSSPRKNRKGCRRVRRVPDLSSGKLSIQLKCELMLSNADVITSSLLPYLALCSQPTVAGSLDAFRPSNKCNTTSSSYVEVYIEIRCIIHLRSKPTIWTLYNCIFNNLATYSCLRSYCRAEEFTVAWLSRGCCYKQDFTNTVCVIKTFTIQGSTRCPARLHAWCVDNRHGFVGMKEERGEHFVGTPLESSRETVAEKSQIR